MVLSASCIHPGTGAVQTRSETGCTPDLQYLREHEPGCEEERQTPNLNDQLYFRVFITYTGSPSKALR